MIWRVLEGEPGPYTTIFTEKLTNDVAAAIAGARGNGYRLVGRHNKISACLLKNASGFLVVNGRNTDAGPEAAGILVDDSDAALDFGWQDDRFEVFSSGAVGPLQMNLPGLRYKPDGQFIYLVGKGGEGHFFAVDFDPVKDV